MCLSRSSRSDTSVGDVLRLSKGWRLRLVFVLELIVLVELLDESDLESLEVGAV